MRRLDERVAIGITIASLAAYDVARTAAVPDSIHFFTNVAMVGMVAAIAAAAGLTWRELGLSRATWRRGLRLGLVAVVIVGIVVLAVALIAGTDSGLVNDDTDVSGSEMLFQSLVEIPLATVLFEEMAFRGLLGSLFHRVTSAGRAVVATSVLFGIWHAPPAWQTFEIVDVAAVAGIIAITAAGGVALQLLKDRTESLVAPMLAHWATNGLALMIVWSLATG